MPSPFDLTTSTNTVTLDNNRMGVASFTAKNSIRRRFRANAKLTITVDEKQSPALTLPPDAPNWLTIAPPPTGSSDTAVSRDFPVDSTQVYQVNIAVPATAPAGGYKFKLTLADETNPDDNFTDSGDVVFTVPEIVKKEPTKFPIWIIPAIIIAVIVIIVIIVVAVTSSNNANADATATAVAAARQTADAQGTAVAGQTATAAVLTQQAQQTAAAAQQTVAAQTAVAQQTKTALNVFLGNWVPVNSGSTIKALTIEDAGNNRVNITYSTLCPPNNLICLLTGPQTFKINNVLFNPQQLAAGIGNTILLIQPANSGQLIVTASVGGVSSSQNFKRQFTLPIGIITDPVMSLPNTTLSDAQIGVLRGFSVETPTPTP
ncbi:MAG: hypothetical protein GC204_07785 [Chloroflexi bacterium]|nr:hypothetical protein [Chloroflexota bacterium]